MHKAYLHLEAGPGVPVAHTTIVRTPPDSGPPLTVGDALAALAASYAARHGVRLDPNCLTARTGVPGDGPQLERNALLSDAVPPGGDLWGEMQETAHADSPPPPQQPAPGNAAVVATILARADAAVSAGRLASAATLYDALVSAAPAHPGALLGRARLWSRAGDWRAATEAATAAVAADPANPVARALLGDCLYEGGDLCGALAAYDAALSAGGSALPPAAAAAARAGAADVLLARRAAAAAALEAAPSPSTTAALLDAHDAAKGAVEAALAADGTCARALVAYARLARSVVASGAGELAAPPGVGGPMAAARALLRALASHPQDQAAQRALADLVVQDGGGECALWAELKSLGVGGGNGNGAADAAALAFLAACLKAHGAARASERFSLAAAEAAPTAALHALAAAQTAELWGDPASPAAAVSRWAARWLGDASSTSSAPPALVAALAAVRDACSGLPPRPLGGGGGGGGGGVLGWLKADPWRGVEALSPPEQPPQQQPSPPPAPPAAAYSEAHLDAIALACTAVRVLYCGGALGRAAAASAALTPVRECASPPLHAGRARNEAAYAACVAALLAPGAAPDAGIGGDDGEGDAPVDTVYVLGDSHTLPLAWRRLGARASSACPPRLTVPLLITGLKVWHLRPGGVFFPRAAWDAAMAGLSPGATVITVVGEIDAREGLLLAVEKLKYRTLEAAIDAAAAAYGSALAALASDARALRIAVHPVPPVLDETRHVVTALNAAVRREVERLERELRQGLAGPAPGRLGWLDLEGRLLTQDDGKALRPDLAFDGTHLAPAYASDVADELARLEAGWRS